MDHGQWDDVYSPFGGAWDEVEVDIVICPSCGSEHYAHEAHIGTLGKLQHFRCRYCGFDFSVRTEQ